VFRIEAEVVKSEHDPVGTGGVRIEMMSDRALLPFWKIAATRAIFAFSRSMSACVIGEAELCSVHCCEVYISLHCFLFSHEDSDAPVFFRPPAFRFLFALYISAFDLFDVDPHFTASQAFQLLRASPNEAKLLPMPESETADLQCEPCRFPAKMNQPFLERFNHTLSLLPENSSPSSFKIKGSPKVGTPLKDPKAILRQIGSQCYCTERSVKPSRKTTSTPG